LLATMEHGMRRGRQPRLVPSLRPSYNERVIGLTAPCLSLAFDSKQSANPLGVAFGLAGWAA